MLPFRRRLDHMYSLTAAHITIPHSSISRHVFRRLCRMRITVEYGRVFLVHMHNIISNIKCSEKNPSTG